MLLTAKRREWAQELITAYTKDRGSEGENETDAQDMISDLLHLVATSEEHAVGILRRAMGNYLAEVEEDAAVEYEPRT